MTGRSASEGTAFVRTDRIQGNVVVVKGRPLPRQRRLDRTLWPVVAKRRLHLTMVACIVAPLVSGMWVPETPLWLSIYAIHCVAAGIAVLMLQRSRDRWIQFLDYLRRGPGPR